MVGTLQLARALTDRDLSDQLLARGVETAMKLLDTSQHHQRWRSAQRENAHASAHFETALGTTPPTGAAGLSDNTNACQPDVEAIVLAAGSLACFAAGLLGRSWRPARLVLGLGLALAAASYATESSLLLRLAILAVSSGLMLFVLEWFGRLPWLSVLDAVMGATAAAAVTAALDGAAELSLAVGGVAGGMALSRWQPSPGMLLIGAGILALGAGADVALVAAPLLVAAALRNEVSVGAGPEFRWTVLAAIIVFATAALTLLAVGSSRSSATRPARSPS